MRKISLFAVLLFSVVRSSASTGAGLPYNFQPDTIFMTNRAPLFLNFGLIQKTYRRAELTLHDPTQDLKINRSHSIGLLTNMEFTLNRVPNFDRMITLETTLGLSSYSFRAEGTVSAVQAGLDFDPEVRVQRYITATELSLKLNQYRRIRKNTYVIAGMGLNVQSIPFQNRIIQGVARVVRNGDPTTETVITNNRQQNFFGFEREDVPVRMGFVATAGLGWTTVTYNMFRIDFRYSSTKLGDVVDSFDSDFGLASEIAIDKSYIGLDFSYTFCVNHRRAKRAITPATK